MKKIFLATLVSLLILSPLVLAQTGLVSQWEFEQNVNDSVGDNHGTRYNFTDGWVTGKYGYALYFNRSAQQYVNFGNDSSLTFGTGDFSLETWFKTTGLTYGTMELFFKILYDTDNPLYELAIINTSTSTNTIYWWTWNGKGGAEDCEGMAEIKNIPDIFDNQWHHAVATRKDNWLYFYYDGELVADGQEVNYTNTSQPCPVNVDHEKELTIGADYQGMSYFYDGAIDNARVWNRALTDTEVHNLYLHNSLTPPRHVSLLQAIIPLIVAVSVAVFVVRNFIFGTEMTIEKLIRTLLALLVAIFLFLFVHGFMLSL